ncbi:MAG: HD domain-containing protein [Oligoflexia bacterium]|nr:HD domain-containing protein [Oligoflexia bacterium]
MAIKVLVADPRNDFGQELANSLNGVGYEVSIAVNGRSVQVLMYEQKFFALILNLAVQDYSAVQVLKYVRTNHPSTKVILITENEELLQECGLDRSKLAKQGLVDVLVGNKIDQRDIQIALEGHRDYRDLLIDSKNNGVSEEQEVNVADDRFVQIRIDEFISINAVQFDVFIQLSNGRYIKILHAGDTFSRERIEKYKNEKKVEYLHFLKEDRIKFIRLQNFVTEKAAGNKAISLSTKVGVLKNLSQIYVEAAYVDGIKPLIVDQGKVLCDNIYEIVHNNNDIYKLLRDYSEFNPSLYNHSYLVAFFSSMIIKQFEWESKIINETLGMAALFHDIGCSKLSPDIREMSFLKMNPEQLNRYKEHCELGVTILDAYLAVPQAVKQIVLQHHERINGEGFPSGLKSHRILVLSQVVGLADEFVRHMVDNQLHPPAAIKKMLSDTNSVKRHSAIIMESFLKVFADPRKLMAM